MQPNRRPQSARLDPAGEPLLAALVAELARSLAVADPRNLKPGELLRTLNSTSLGAILTERKLRGHRERAGGRISDADGKRLDLLRYAAWLASERCNAYAAQPAPATVSQGTASPAELYFAKKERERARNASASKSGRDIGELPPVADPERRARALADPHVFNRAYFPKRFYLEAGDDQRLAVDECERIIDEGGVKAQAAPRGDGKTTRVECAAIRAICRGQRRFVAVIGATKSAAGDILQSIKGEFETNEILAGDFPEICYPIQKLEGIYNRCKGQLYRGQPTHLKWSGDQLVFPTIEGSAASGIVLCVRGITGQIRGMKFRRSDGETVRPDLTIVDDPQTKRSAHSPAQCKRRLEIITGDVLGLAGPGRSIACFIPCTVIVKGDLADQILDRELQPSFQGVRSKLVYAWPAREDLWDQYASLRRDCLRRGDKLGKSATAFYRKNKKEMDRGVKVAWPARKDPGELSAIQNAMNLRIDRPATFDAEFQNEPKGEDDGDDKLPTAAVIAVKINSLPRGIVPLAATVLTGFIDIQQRLLYWGVCAWAPDFTGSLIDYGTWPDQRRTYFTYREAPRPIQSLPEFATTDVGGALRGALDRLEEELLTRDFRREDGPPMRISLLLKDSGDFTDTVYQQCRESKYAALTLPTKGMGIKSDKPPMSEWKKHEGQVIGEEWILGRVENKRAVRLLTFDTNFWKTRLFAGLATLSGARGCFSLFGEKARPPDHSMVADHHVAESRTKTFGRGRTVYVYELKPEKPDNHLLDVCVGNAVAASKQGCRLIGKPVTPKKPAPRSRPRVSPLKV
jgi:hypothetical protein